MPRVPTRAICSQTGQGEEGRRDPKADRTWLGHLRDIQTHGCFKVIGKSDAAPRKGRAVAIALHGEIKVNGQVIGRWTAQRILTRQSGRHTYRWEAYDKGRHTTGDLDHNYDDGAIALAVKVLRAAHHQAMGGDDS